MEWTQELHEWPALPLPDNTINTGLRRESSTKDALFIAIAISAIPRVCLDLAYPLSNTPCNVVHNRLGQDRYEFVIYCGAIEWLHNSSPASSLALSFLGQCLPPLINQDGNIIREFQTFLVSIPTDMTLFVVGGTVPLQYLYKCRL